MREKIDVVMYWTLRDRIIYLLRILYMLRVDSAREVMYSGVHLNDLAERMATRRAKASFNRFWGRSS